MGSKAEPTPPPAVEPAGGSMGSEMMMQMLGMMMQGMAAPQAPIPEIPEAPEVEEDPVIDWRDKQAELAKKVAVDYEDDQNRKRNRTDTILTSPLLDEELETLTSLIAE